jgi:hypothetical protein
VAASPCCAQAPRLDYDNPLCASLDGFTLRAATRAGALDTAGREALLRYVLRPPIAQKRVEPHGARKSTVALMTPSTSRARAALSCDLTGMSIAHDEARMVLP